MPPASAIAIAAPTSAAVRSVLILLSAPPWVPRSALDDLGRLHRHSEAVRQPRGLKLYGPSQEQAGNAGHATMSGPAWKCANTPVPPQNVTMPVRVSRSRSTCPNAVLLPGPT